MALFMLRHNTACTAPIPLGYLRVRDEVVGLSSSGGEGVWRLGEEVSGLGEVG